MNIGYFFGTFAAMMLQKELGISTKAQGLRLRTNLQSVSALLKTELAQGCPRNLRQMLSEWCYNPNISRFSK